MQIRMGITKVNACLYSGDKISAIKALREMTGLGLKDSKDYIENAMRAGMGHYITLNCPEYRPEFSGNINSLNDLGLHVALIDENAPTNQATIDMMMSLLKRHIDMGCSPDHAWRMAESIRNFEWIIKEI